MERRNQEKEILKLLQENYDITRLCHLEIEKGVRNFNPPQGYHKVDIDTSRVPDGHVAKCLTFYTPDTVDRVIAVEGIDLIGIKQELASAGYSGDVNKFWMTHPSFATEYQYDPDYYAKPDTIDIYGSPSEASKCHYCMSIKDYKNIKNPEFVRLVVAWKDKDGKKYFQELRFVGLTGV